MVSSREEPAIRTVLAPVLAPEWLEQAYSAIDAYTARAVAQALEEMVADFKKWGMHFTAGEIECYRREGTVEHLVRRHQATLRAYPGSSGEEGRTR